MTFCYEEAFQRNRGLVGADQQQCLRTSRIAIAGLGGVGGAQAHALARLGVGKFTLADPDTFELSNFNRQLGATMSTLGKSKVEAIADQLLDVNPELEITLLKEGVSEATIDKFLDGVAVVVDALDFNCFKERFILFRAARERGIWVLNVAPPGFGTTMLAFDPAGMSFEEYFDINPNMSRDELSLGLMFGISPNPWALQYIDRQQMKLADGRFPCVSPAFFLAAGITAAQVFNLLCRDKPPAAAPTVMQFDALLQKYKLQHCCFGMGAPWTKLMKLFVARKLGLHRVKTVEPRPCQSQSLG